MTVLEVVEVVAVLVHLAPYAVRVAVLHVDVDAFESCLGECLPYFVAEDCQTVALRVLVAAYESLELGELMWAAEAETEVLELGLDVVESEAVGERSVEVVCLAGYLHLLVGLHGGEGAHVVETVGELDQKCADVVLHGV